MAWSKLLLLALVQCMGSLAKLSDNTTVLAIPFLFPWGDSCSQRYPLGDTHQYRFFYTSQIAYAPTLTELYTVHIPGNGLCSTHPQFFYTFTFSGSYFYEHNFMTQEDSCNNSTLCYQCQNKVLTLVAHFEDNPSLSMIAHLFGTHFNHSLAIYPVPPQPTAEENRLYTYRVLFGALRHGKMDGIVIEVIYSQTNVTVYNAKGAVAIRSDPALRNGLGGHELNDDTFELIDQCNSSIIWIEPKPVNNCTDTAVSLQDVVIESTLPIKVFTNQAQCNSSRKFSLKSQLVHEMPPPNKWGQHFVLDIQQASVFPKEIRTTLHYDISFLSSQPNTAINVTYYDREEAVDTERYWAGNDSLRIKKTAIQVKKLTHIVVYATGPVMAVYTLYNEGPEAVYLSIVVQPVSWFANIQTVALSRANGSSQPDCRYHVSVVAPTDTNNPRDILILNAHTFNNNTPLSTQEGLRSFKSGDYELFSFSPNPNTDADTFLVWHSDPTVDIGVTVFAYCLQKHYAYSNGYIADGSPRDSRDHHSLVPSPVEYRAILGALALLLAIIVSVLSVICICRRWRTRTTFRVRSDECVLISREPGTDYEYDVFILYPEEDEDFVQRFVYEPVRRRNYRVLWRGEGSHDLFQPGSDVVADLATAIQMSRKIIVVCTRHFTRRGGLDREVSFFKDVQKSERIRRLIPVVIEGEYKSQQFKEYNQIRVGCRDDLSDRRTAEDMLQRLVNSIGEPIHSSVESLVFL